MRDEIDRELWLREESLKIYLWKLMGTMVVIALFIETFLDYFFFFIFFR